MPRDADFGRDLAERLSAKFHDFVGDVRFTYDAFLELDRIDADSPYCILSTNLYTHLRESRAHWRETIQLILTLVSPAGATDDSDWIDRWLDDWDLLIRESREIPVYGKHKPISVETDERYDAEMFHNNRRLVTQATFNFGNVEVI